ncbi:MAG TPA: CPBP family intramembrane glutamic endopeptidase [Candidatus Limnocylindrales bacterium]|nr:CPBP family intramembrane glutamic endopeptidase [Candidatus Limnocylindrales bacterium]
MTTSAPGPESGTPTDPPATDPSGVRPGTSMFTIEGRSAPALLVIGWLATLLGLGFIAVGILSSRGLPSTLLLVGGLAVLSVGLVAASGSQGIERRARRASGYAGPSPLLVFGASVPVSILVLVLVAVPLGALGFPLEGPPGALLSVIVQAIVYVGLIRLLVVDVGALDWAAMGIRRLDARALAEMGGGAVWAVPLVFVTALVSVVLLAIFPVTPESPLPPTGQPVGFAISLLAGVVVAPFGEEILFRGFATTAWARGIGVRGGLVRAALVFAFAHILTISGSSAGDAIGLAVVGFATRVPIAIALGVLFVRRGTIWSSFGLHAAFNGILLVLAEAASRTL